MTFFESIWFWAARALGEVLGALLIVFWIAVVCVGLFLFYRLGAFGYKAWRRIASHCRHGR